MSAPIFLHPISLKFESCYLVESTRNSLCISQLSQDLVGANPPLEAEEGTRMVEVRVVGLEGPEDTLQWFEKLSREEPHAHDVEEDDEEGECD